jgi:hypothetical protein
MTKSAKVTLRQAVEQVLTGKPKGLTVAQITEQAVPLTAVAGATPMDDTLIVHAAPTRGEAERLLALWIGEHAR